MKVFTKMPVLLFSLVLVIVGARVAAPYIVKDLINQQLEEVEGISGYVQDVDLALFRGAYQLNGLTLYLQPNQDQPSVYAKTVDLSILWSGLFHGDIVAEVYIDQASFVFIDQANQENSIQEEATQADTWLTLINFASPISIDKVVVTDSKAELFNIDKISKNRTYLENVEGEILNITNSRAFSGNKVASFQLTADIMGIANANLAGSVNPDTALPTFDIDFSMQKLPVVSIDKFIDFYAPVDVEQGDIDAAIEISSLNGEVQGYVKAGIYDANVFSWEQDINQDDDGLFTGIFEGLVDGLASIFESDAKNLIAINVPIEGTIDNTQISTFDAIRSLFHNAFVNEYEISVDESISLSQDSESN
ncbi:DUF748 domain-containing protein [Paraglaciecola sp. 2405UD69-4]|uniref:DUF748 domain-containing protein n=1 Tax=Paraglaciecola sp. 2405UD69-4 TaxID=3391836 RepID=UPI0039C9BF4A